MKSRHVIFTICTTLFASLLFWSTNASAQFNQYHLPVEQGLLDSHVDLQYFYARPGLLGSDQELNLSVLSVEGQYAWSDRLEVGINLPFLQHAWTGAGGSTDTEFGNLMLNLKGRLFGLGEMLSVALYANAMLPTASGVEDRDYAVLFPGAAATAKVLGALVGGSFQGVWTIQGDADDHAYVGIDAYGGFSLLGILTLKLAVQYLQSVKIPGDTSVSALALTPGVEVDILDVVRAGLASRIALNDDGKALYYGRASLLFHGGISF